MIFIKALKVRFARAVVQFGRCLVCAIMLVTAGAIGETESEKVISKPIVVSSIRPLQLIVDEIAGDGIDSRLLVTGLSSPHDFSLTIAQALVLDEADLLVWVGPNFEHFLRRGVHSEALLAMSDSSKSAASADNHLPPIDQHMWLSRTKVVEFSQALLHELIRLVPENKSFFTQRQQDFVRMLNAQHEANRMRLVDVARVPFAVHHDAYRHLVREYNLVQVLSLTSVPHERLSAKKLNLAGQQMASAACLLSEQAEQGQASRYAKLFDKPLVTIDLLASKSSLTNFAQYLEEIGLALNTCLRS